MNAVDIRDIQPPVGYSTDWLPWMIALGMVLIGIIVFFLLKRFYHPRISAQPESLRPAWKIARESILALKQKEYPSKNLIKQYFSELSDILRVYIEARFGIDAPEMTTEEFLESLRFSNSLSVVQKKQMQNFLISCDMVKFAKYGASIEDMDKSMEKVETFVSETMVNDLNGAQEHKNT